MKKQFAILGVLVLGAIATILMPSTALAKGETYQFTNASASSGYGGSEITAMGGAFKSATTFKLVSTATAEKYKAKVSGYSVYYLAESFNLKDAAATYVPACKTDPAFIALKTTESQKGLLYPSPATSGGTSTSCGTQVGMNFSNLTDEGDEMFINADLTIKADTIQTSYLDGYYNVLAGPLTPLKNQYYQSLGTRAPCSSQGCNDTTWKAMVATCWQSARSSAADSARLSGQGGVAYDVEQGTKDNFARCLDGKVGDVATAQQILSLISGVTAASVNEGGSTAGEQARNELDAAVDAASTGADDPASSSSCVIEGVGWIICPITNFLAGVSDMAFSAISNFLMVNVKLLDTNNGTYAAWTVFRNIANVAFVIVFMIIIYSQLTGQGVSNYGVKKTLPRLIIAAILVNVSFFVCQLAVDVTQIIGGSIRDVFAAVPISSGEYAVPTWTTVMGDVLMGAGIAAAVVAGAAAGIAILSLSISLPVMLAALFAVLMTVIILVGRQAGIVILIILSPLAFVAFMLPNTEKWFSRWMKMFGALLLVFPIIALLYGGGELTSKIISSVANSPGTPADMKFWLSITAIAVAAIPLIMTPSILKGAMNGMGTIGGKLSGMASKANSKVGTAANTQSRYGEAKQGIKNGFALRRASRRVRSNFQQGLDSSRLGKAIGLDKGAARAAKVVDAEEGSEVEAAIAQFGLDPTIDSVNKIPKMQAALEDAIRKGDTTKARAAQKILLGSGNPGIAAVQSVYSSSQMQSHLGNPGLGETVGRLRSDLVSAGIKGKNNALTTYGYSGASDSFNDTLNSAGTFDGLNPVELAGQSLGNLENVVSKHPAAVSPEMAAAVLANNDASALLDNKKRALFTSIANGTLAPATPAQSPTAQQAGAGPGSVGATPAPATAAQPAPQAAQQPVQGTAPFSVNTQGTVTINHNTPPTGGAGTPPATP